jgi:ergothioneine biosynthesis protein EgtB
MSSETLRQHAALADRRQLIGRFAVVRALTERFVEPLEPEDCVVQSMPDVSPTRWHLAHTTWFFETFVLAHAEPGHQPFDPHYEDLFNSYYRTVGEPFPRHRRGLLSRPTVREVLAYRRHVDEQVQRLLERTEDVELLRRIALGLHHEQQHQELILTDIKHVLACNPLHPVYRRRRRESAAAAPRARHTLRWLPFEEGTHWIGHGGDDFCFDNERPRHRTFVGSFELASRLVTNGEFLEFVEAGGYRQPESWLDDGRATVAAEGWDHPIYWRRGADGRWHEFTLSGLQPLEPDAPVCHVSYYEADAYARWAGARLPTEAEWEVAAAGAPIAGNFVDDELLRPRPAEGGPPADSPTQMFGDAWEWTASAYSAYPGFRPLTGSLGEYNGKFMCNQFVLRGGSCLTSLDHVRPTYRNFFYPQARWQMTGIRLAR